MKAITEEEKLESRVYKNEAAGDGDENEAEVEGDVDSCTEVESSEIGDDPGDGNPEFSETEDGEKLKQNSVSSGEKQRSSNHAHQVLDKMPKTATVTKTKGNFSVSFSDSFLSCSQSSFVNVVENLAPGKCSVDEINQPSSEVEDMVFDKMPRPILTAEGNPGKPFIPSSSELFSPCVGFAVNDLNPDRMLGNRRNQVGEKGDFPNPAHKVIDKMSKPYSVAHLKGYRSWATLICLLKFSFCAPHSITTFIQSAFKPINEVIPKQSKREYPQKRSLSNSVSYWHKHKECGRK
ncbi:hypothetical protein U1Q18_009974 [Sarracenia purpurea var. burkii]